MTFQITPELIAEFDAKIRGRVSPVLAEDPRVAQRKAAELAMPVSRLRLLLAVEPESGNLCWLPEATSVARGTTLRGLHLRREGQRKPSADGYKRITIEGRIFLQHRVVWALTHGEWPDDQVDHKDRDRGNNRPDNLRLASNESNHQNRTDNSSGTVGVVFEKARKKWKAYKRFDYVMHNIGRYDTQEEAVAARALYTERYNHICSQF